MMETGLFQSTPEENRKCHLCDLGQGENEMHLLFYCPLYHNLKYRPFLKLSVECPDFLSMSDERRRQYLFTKKKCFI